MRDDAIAGEDWPSRDYVIATVVAHAWGHRIQMLTGLAPLSIFPEINREENAPLIDRQRQFQAGCYAGLLARYARDRGLLSAGDLEEARVAMILDPDARSYCVVSSGQRRGVTTASTAPSAWRIA